MEEEDANASLAGLSQGRRTDDQLIDWMVAQPILTSRPIVASALGVRLRLCRRSEVVRDLLRSAQGAAFVKADVAAVVDTRLQ